MATPHTRGSTCDGVTRPAAPDGYPAYAGIDPYHLGVGGVGQRLPRIRGDRPYNSYWSNLRIRATPHTRGSTLIQAGMAQFGLGYPAYAGIDPR